LKERGFLWNKLCTFTFQNLIMKLLAYFVFLLSIVAIAQPNTDVYLMDLGKTDSTFTISNFKNVSNSAGYDNQPSFLDDNRLLYAGSEDGQTEIQLYYISENTQHRINAKTAGGEYSPIGMPEGKNVAAVRLDTTGLQRLYRYDFTNPNQGDSQILLNELEIAYYAFYDKDWVVASILSGGQLDLVIANIPRDESKLYAENVGRSIHKVPNTTTVSYTVVNEEKNLDVFVVDVNKAEETYFVCQLPVGIQDHTWIDATTLLLGSGSKLYVYDLFGSGEWVEVADLSANSVQNITRISVSPDGKRIALVAETK
jgi:Tol biopolymer transport system component